MLVIGMFHCNPLLNTAVYCSNTENGNKKVEFSFFLFLLSLIDQVEGQAFFEKRT